MPKIEMQFGRAQHLQKIHRSLSPSAVGFARVLLLLTSIATGGVTAAAKVDEVKDGLECWFCRGDENSLCGNGFNGTAVPGIVEKGRCSVVVPGRLPATHCFKEVNTDADGKTSVVRNCAFPGDCALKYTNFLKSKTSKEGECIVHSGQKLEVCFCNGDYCNGAGGPKMTGISGLAGYLGILTFGFGRLYF